MKHMSDISNYLKHPPRTLYEVCRHAGRDANGKACPMCSVRDICERGRYRGRKMTPFRYALLSLTIGFVLSAVPLMGLAAGKLDAMSTLCVLIALCVGTLAGGFIERVRPVQRASDTAEPVVSSAFRRRSRLLDAESRRC
jgi:hypothetical protein